MAEKKKEEAPKAVEPAAESDFPHTDEWGPIGRVTAETRRPLGRIVPRLANDPIPGFHARWVNDDGESRIANALAAGYTFIEGPDGKPVRKLVGTKRAGGGMFAYRMKVPLDWYLADRARMEQARKQLMAEMMRGKLGRGVDDGRYLPTRAGQPINSVTTSDGRFK